MYIPTLIEKYRIVRLFRLITLVSFFQLCALVFAWRVFHEKREIGVFHHYDHWHSSNHVGVRLASPI